MGGDERVSPRVTRYRGEGPGDRSPGPLLGLEGRDLAGLGLARLALGPLDIGGGEAQARTDLVGRDLDL